jgi:HD-GYP domain-containing protein (c-di-GMP phosphodiesterase class II)
LHVCLLAVELSRHLGFSREELEEIGAATLVHDIGKVFVPLAVLRKPAALDDAEFALVSRHPVDGAAVLASETGMPDCSALVAFEHHIHLDQSGYPTLQHPRELHPYSMIATVADVYDALTTARPYRPALTPHRSLEVMKEQFVGKLEPRLLERFIEMLGPYPWGTLLRVSDDLLVAITRPNRKAPDNPYSRAIHLSTESPTIDEEVPLRAVTSDARLEIVDPAEIGLDLIALLAGAK